MQNNLCEAAKTNVQRGRSAIPVNLYHPQTPKSPLGPWKEYQTRFPTLTEIDGWFKNPKASGLALVCGQISGNFEVYDIDQKYSLDKTLWKETEAGLKQVLPDLFSKLTIAKTINGGYHIFVRLPEGVTPICGKIANRPATDEEKKIKPDEKTKVLTERKGDGGFVVIAPTPKYEFIQGSLDSTPLITEEERAQIVAVLASFDEMPEAENDSAQYQTKKKWGKENSGLSPFDDYNERGDVESELLKAGYKLFYSRGNVKQFTRPGKSFGVSVSLFSDTKILKAFSTSTEFDTGKKGYNAVQIYTLLSYGSLSEDSYSKASKALYELGYGDRHEVKEKPKKENQATRILNFAENLELFHTPDGDGFATIETISGHFENHFLRTKAFRSWLAYQFFQAEGQMPSTQALQDVINTLEGKAIFEGEEIEMFVRLASANRKIYLDLCNKNWQIVEISKKGWRVIESKDVPVKFYRTKAMLPLPTPKKGGDFHKLRDFLSVNKDEYILICAFLVACLRPGLPFPIAIVKGEKGTAKSTTCRTFRRLIDPNKTDFRSLPRDERDLVISATNSWLVSFDNISGIPKTMSDSLCRVSTGSGLSTRTLYENTDETIFNAKRPILLNGIGEISSETDLLDRAILISLRPIAKDQRITEESYWSAFEKSYTDIFSGLLDVVSSALKAIESTNLKDYPRMADFTQWATAAEKGFGFDNGDFIKAFEANQNSANFIALEGSPLAEVVQGYAKKVKTFKGNLQEFLDALKPFASEEILKSKEYPKTPRGIRSKLERINPNLRTIGIHIEFLERTNQGQQISLRVLEQEGFQPSQPSQPSPTLETKDLSSDGRGDGWNNDNSTVTQPSPNGTNSKHNGFSHLNNPSDVSDVSDGLKQTYSNNHLETELIEVEEVV